MSIQFSDVTNNLGICQQARSLARVDETQWPTWKIVNSTNNHLDFVAGYLLTLDKKFDWDDTNHSALPEGTMTLTANQADYSFLTDEDNNRIVTLLRIDVQDSSGVWRALKPIDQSEITGSLSNYKSTAGVPEEYDKIADNIIRLYPAPSYTRTAAIKFTFQRTPSYFVATDTTKEPGVSPLLHRGFIIAAAYDIALTLGLPNLQPLSVEMQKEVQKLERYISSRQKDERGRMKPNVENTR